MAGAWKALVLLLIAAAVGAIIIALPPWASGAVLVLAAAIAYVSLRPRRRGRG